MASQNETGAEIPPTMNKPVYTKNSEIQLDKTKRIGDFEMYESLHKKSWRRYTLYTIGARSLESISKIQ